MPPVFRFAPSPERLSASRPCAVGAAQCRHGARRRRAPAAAHRGHRRRRAAGRNSRRRSTRTSPGSASPGKQPVRRQSEHFDDYRAALAQLDAHGPRLSELREPRRDRAPGRRARGAGRGRAIPTARRSIRATRKSMTRGRARAPHRGRRALCAAARHGGGDRAHRPAHLDRDRRRPCRRDRHRRRRPRSLGRRGPGAQGDADELSSVGGGRRRRCRASPTWCAAGPVPGDQRAPAAAGAARSAGAALPPPPADSRRRRPQAVEIDPGHRPARAARARRHTRGRYPRMVGLA